MLSNVGGAFAPRSVTVFSLIGAQRPLPHCALPFARWGKLDGAVEAWRIFRSLNREQRNTFLACFLGWTLDALDFFLLTFVVRDVAAEFSVSIVKVTFAITLTLMMRPLGALIFGLLGDRFGRRVPLMVNIIFYSVMALLTAFSPNYTVFLIFRALYGVGMGGEWGLGASLTMESLPARARGLASGILQQGYSCGFLFAAAVYWLVFPHFGWRALFVVGTLPALLVIYIRAHVPESAVWERNRQAGRKSLGMGRFMREHWRLFVYAVLLMTAFNYMSHGTQDLYPTFLQKQRGLSVNQTAPIAIIYNLGAICGGTLLGHFSQRWGRRRTIIIAARARHSTHPGLDFFADAPASHRGRLFHAIHGAGCLGRGTGALERALAPGLARHFPRGGLSAGKFLFRQCGDVAGETRGAFR